MSEHETQAAFFDYIRWKQYDRLFAIAAIPNQRKASFATGRRFKREGVLPGFPDVGVFVSRQGFHGLFIEFKHGKNRLSPEQRAVKALLESAGFRYVVSYSVDHAIAIFEEYINGPDNGAAKDV